MKYLIALMVCLLGLGVQAATQPTTTNSMANWANAKLVSYKAGVNPPSGSYASPDKIANGTWSNLKHQ